MITLRPLVAADLAAIESWFDDAETRHWLGDRSWPLIGLKLAGPDRHALLGLREGLPVGLVDIEVGVDGRAAFAIVVAPAQRGRGVGRQVVEACLSDARFDDVTEWYAGVEGGNIASQQLLIRAGFSRMTDEDSDGFSYFARRRAGWPDLPWLPYQPMLDSPARRSRRKLAGGNA